MSDEDVSRPARESGPPDEHLREVLTRELGEVPPESPSEPAEVTPEEEEREEREQGEEEEAQGGRR